MICLFLLEMANLVQLCRIVHIFINDRIQYFVLKVSPEAFTFWPEMSNELQTKKSPGYIWVLNNWKCDETKAKCRDDQIRQDGSFSGLSYI